jgi:hypothetical protein
MRNANSMILLAVATGTLAGCHTAPPTVSENVMACGRIADTARRYRCYDSLNTAMRPASAPASTAPSQSRAHQAPPAPQLQANAPSAAPSVAQAAPAPAENQVGEEYLPPAARAAAPAKAITVRSSIASLDEVRPKIYLIKLSNGQVWRHEGIQTMAFFSVGDDVTIKRYLFGSYHMSSPATGGATNWVRVTRIE